MLYQVIIVIHILLGISIIGLVLMQQGKGADAGAAFGSGASGTVFGAQGSASFLSRTTAVFATLFFITSLGLAVLGGYHGKKPDLIETISEEVKEEGKIPDDVPLSPAKSKEEAAAIIEKLEEAAKQQQTEAPAAAMPEAQVPAAPVIKAVEPSSPTPSKTK
jgi:preprotein translocase subunit SecG